MRFDAFLIPTPTLTLNLPLKQCKYIIGQPIRSLGRLYTSGLSDKDMGKIILRQLSEGLSKIDASQLPGKYKVWCYHFTLYPRVMWPLKLCEVTSSAVSRMEAKANCFIRKWLGLPWCFSAAGLYGWNSLQLPLKSITLGYKQEKARLVMELRDSSDRAEADVNSRVETGRKWRAKEEVQKVIGRLQHKQIVQFLFSPDSWEVSVWTESVWLSGELNARCGKWLHLVCLGCLISLKKSWELSASHRWFQVLWLPRQFDRLITGIVGGACMESDE